jgi:electron-transferring-flavoprotein dehydrogenase
MLYKDNKVIGVTTHDFGIDKKGEKKDSYMEGIDLIGKQVVLAEGCRGSLSESVIKKFDLAKDKAP